MKKLFSLVTVLVMAWSVAYADYDLRGFSLEELIKLRDQVQQAMWKTEEYQSVTVPQGVWVVGEDIPAGKWNVKCAPGEGAWMQECTITWGGKPDSDGYIPYSARKGEITLHDPQSSFYKEGSMTEYILELEKGDYVSIDAKYNKAVFSTYTGKPSLGFK